MKLYTLRGVYQTWRRRFPWMPARVELPCSLDDAAASAGFPQVSRRSADSVAPGAEEFVFQRGRDKVVITFWQGAVHEIGYIFPTRFAFQEQTKLSTFLADWSDVDLEGGAPLPWKRVMNTDYYLRFDHTRKPVYALYTKLVGGVLFGTQVLSEAHASSSRSTAMA